MSPLDKTSTPASSTAPILTSNIKDAVVGSSANVAVSNSKANFSVSHSKANVAVSDNLVVMQCRNCRRPFGRVVNEWIIFATGYYLEVKPEIRAHDFDLKNGHEIPILDRIKQLRDCVLVPMECKSCKLRVGLVVKRTPPDKNHLLGCAFIKVVQDVILISQSDVEVQPHVISARYTNTGYLPSSKAVAASAEHTVNLAKHQPPKLQHVKAQPVAQRSSPSEHSTSSTSAVPQVLHSVDTRQLLRKATDSDNDPDNFAIDIINRGGSWREAHNVWEKMTSRQLSPGAFGKHIQEVGHSEPSSVEHDHQQESSAPPAVPMPPAPSTQTSIPMSLTDHVPQQPLRKHPTSMLVHKSSTPVAHRTLRPLIAQTATPHPAGDSIQDQQQRNPSDNLAMQPAQYMLHGDQAPMADELLALEAGMRLLRRDMTNLQSINKDLIERNEELREQLRTTRPATAAADYNAIQSLSEAVMSASTKAAAIDTMKVQIGTLVHRVSLLEAWNGRNEIDLSATNNSELSIPAEQSAIPAMSAQKRPHDAIYLTEPDTANKHVRTDPARAMLNKPSIVNNHPFSSPAPRRGRGRPRKQHPSASMSPGRSLIHQSANIPSSTLQARVNPVISNGYFANHENMPDDGAHGPDRGRVIRRGTGGVNITPPSEGTIRRRTKPVRNEEGILIRLDGKPDMRSVSSAQNLKKRFDTLRDLGKGQPGVESPGPGVTMTTGSTHKRPFDTIETVASISDNDDGEMHISILEQFKRSKKDEPRVLNHTTVLKGMFPNGFNHATGGIDIAAMVFARESQPTAALQERTAVVGSVDTSVNDNNRPTPKSQDRDSLSSEE